MAAPCRPVPAGRGMHAFRARSRGAPNDPASTAARFSCILPGMVTAAQPIPPGPPTAAPAPGPKLPLAASVGYQVRITHRLVQRALQARISRHGVTLGMWYFLRVLWQEDGITQRELSNRIGTMEPTTMSAIMAMEKAGIVRRVRNAGDRRKINVFLTDHGRSLEPLLLPGAIAVVEEAVRGIPGAEVSLLLRLLGAMQRNLGDALAAEPPGPPGDGPCP